MLDGRQFRSDQACGDGNQIVPCGDWADPARTMLGPAQEKWLYDGLAASRTRWQVIANQTMVGPLDSLPGPEVRLPMDNWSGYPAARDRMLKAIAERAANRTVVITGDIHSNFVNELRSSFSKPDQPTVAAEFVGTSISSGGDGSDQTFAPEVLAENPHLKWHNRRRGYVSCRVTPDEWTAEYRTVAFISKPGAPVETPTKWRVVRGRAGIQVT
jgi:alkaline phosphatase D